MAVACPNAVIYNEPEPKQRLYVVQVRARQEKLVKMQWEGKDHECFLPIYTTKKPGYDRIRQNENPLFPGYLFCRLDPVKRLPVLTTPGVMKIVGVGREPVPIDDSEIAAIHCVLISGLPARPYPYQHLQIGQRVCIERGPFSGPQCSILPSQHHHP